MQQEQNAAILDANETARLLGALSGPYRLVAEVLHATGLRFEELQDLRVKDVLAGGRSLHVRGGRGEKGRFAALPSGLAASLSAHLVRVQKTHAADLQAGGGEAPPPEGLAERLPLAAGRWCWQFVFPAARRVRRADGSWCRPPVAAPDFLRALRSAAASVRVVKPLHSASFRHAFAARRVEEGIDLRALQSALGHIDLATTVRYARSLSCAEPDRAPLEIDRRWLAHYEAPAVGVPVRQWWRAIWAAA